jgi:hypothetical protein
MPNSELWYHGENTDVWIQKTIFYFLDRFLTAVILPKLIFFFRLMPNAKSWACEPFIAKGL